ARRRHAREPRRDLRHSAWPAAVDAANPGHPRLRHSRERLLHVRTVPRDYAAATLEGSRAARRTGALSAGSLVLRRPHAASHHPRVGNVGRSSRNLGVPVMSARAPLWIVVVLCAIVAAFIGWVDFQQSEVQP